MDEKDERFTVGEYVQRIPETVRRLRGSWTLKVLAEKTGLSISFLSDIERGRTMPSITTLDKIFQAYGSQLIIGCEITDEVGESKDKRLKRALEIIADCQPPRPSKDSEIPTGHFYKLQMIAALALRTPGSLQHVYDTSQESGWVFPLEREA